MGDNIREQTLKELRALKVRLDAIAENKSQIYTLENRIQQADRNYSWAWDAVRSKYIPVTRNEMEHCDPEKEAAKRQKKLPAKEVKKKCLPHAIIVSTMCLVWLIACVIILNQQILPDYGTGRIVAAMTPRVLYALLMVGMLFSNLSDGNRSQIMGGCVIYSIPAALAAINTIVNAPQYFADVNTLLIFDAVLGLGAWIAALFVPAPNKAFYKVVREIEEQKNKALENDENLEKEAERAYKEGRYKTNKAIIAVQKEADAARDQLLDAKKQLEQTKKNIEEATARLQSCTIFSWDELPYAPHPLEHDVMRNGQFAVDFMLSAIERGRADTLEEALECWADEVRRREKQEKGYQEIYKQVAAEADRRDSIESANREKMREQERKQKKLQQEKERVEKMEKARDDLYR